MRNIAVLLAGASLFACNQPADESAPDGAEVTEATFSYDGADYGDDDAAKIAHGNRISTVLGCKGCHTATLEGQWFPPNDPKEYYAPNLTISLQDMDDTQLEKLLREGVHPTRDEMWYMPSELYQYLSEADMAALIAYLRAVEPTGEQTPYVPMPDEAKEQFAAVGFLEASALVKHGRENPPPELGEELAFGRHIAMTTCAECHASDLKGYANFTPGLAEVSGMYDDEAFRKLLTTGEGLEGRELGLMAIAGQYHFGAFTDAERQAVVDYAQALAAQAVSDGESAQ